MAFVKCIGNDFHECFNFNMQSGPLQEKRVPKILLLKEKKKKNSINLHESKYSMVNFHHEVRK